MESINGKLVAFHSSDGLKLKGYLVTSTQNRATIVHIHGNVGNFYENDFISTMAERYNSAGFNFFSFNNRGHDGIAEAYLHGELVYIGAAVENLEECVFDIEGAVKYASSLGSRVILQGHSLGCLKILIYLVAKKRPLDFILLSPSDVYQLQSNYIYPETVEEQLSRIKTTYPENPEVLLPQDDFGIRQPDLRYHIPITARAFSSLFNSRWLGLLRYKNPMEYLVSSAGFVYLGGRDLLRTEEIDTIRQFFSERIEASHFCICEEGDHHFHGLESHVIGEIIDWIGTRDL